MTWDELPGAILSFKSYLPFINRLLGPYNIQLKTSRGILFLPPSDAYVRSFLYLLYTLDLLHKSSEQSSLISGPGLNSSPPGAKNPGIFCGSSTSFLEVVKEKYLRNTTWHVVLFKKLKKYFISQEISIFLPIPLSW